MKQVYITLLILFTVSFAEKSNAQHRELGVRFTSVNNFDLLYKFGQEPDKLTRIRAINGSYFNNSGDDITNSEGLNIGFAIGREKHASLDERFDFIHGLDGSISYLSTSADSFNNDAFRFSIGYLVGGVCEVTEKISAGAEVIPNVYYTSFSGGNNNVDQYGVQFGNGAAALTLTYKFEKLE